jgi:hypothetical protein
MATFLTTPRMSPELRARVERAVSHRTRARHAAAKVGLKSPFASRERLRVARVLPLVALLLVVGLGSTVYVQGRRTVEAERATLLNALAERRAGLPPGHEAFLAETDRWVLDAASDSAGAETVDPSLKAPGALDALLARPAVYVRGPAAELADGAKLNDAARASIKDSFLFCLLHAPPSSSEKDLLTKVRGVYFGGAKVDEQTANVRRLAEARMGLGVLGTSFEGAARAAEDVSSLKRLLRDLQGAPTDEAKRAAAAELLLVVADGAAQTGAREARVTLIDLAAKKVLLRTRPRIDSQGRSPAAQIHRDDMDGCGLALTVRRGVEALSASAAVQ